MERVKKLLNTREEINNIMVKPNCYVFGAGKVAKTVIKYASNEGYLLEKVVVSSTKGNPLEILGIQVMSLEQIKSEARQGVLIVSVLEKFHAEIERELEDSTFDKIYFVSYELFQELTYCLGSFEIEHATQLSQIIRNTSGAEWSNEHERNLIKENWGNVTLNDNFAEKYLRLIKGLDEESIVSITRILKRQERCLNCDTPRIDLFTEREQKELKDLKENFYDLILKISDGLYGYKKYLLPIRRFEPSVFYYKHGIEKVEMMESVKGKTIIDVGAYIGDSSLILSELEPNRIIAFEAVPKHVDMFHKTMMLNHVENVCCETLALGKEKSSLKIHLAGASSTMIDRKGVAFQGEIEVPDITLDEYVEKNKVDDVGLIKVDIEGAEPDFLAGARKTIEKNKPIILLSIYHNAHDFFELKPLIESWNLGYKFKIYKPTDGNIAGETLLIAEVR